MFLVFPNEIIINILMYLSINRNLIFPCINKKLYKLIKQNPKIRTFAPKITKKQLRINWKNEYVRRRQNR